MHEPATTKQTFVFCGGGSGGHLFPGIAVAEELRARSPETKFFFVGSQREVERKILTDFDAEHVPLEVLPASRFLRNPFRFLSTHRAAVRTAKELIEREQPAAVVGLGGFASVPVAEAAARSDIPVVLLEQNIVPGRATRWLSRRATAVCASFPDASDGLRGAPISEPGNPVRREIRELQRIDQAKTKTLLILGGSQGATRLNDIVLQAISTSTDHWQDWHIIHQTGETALDHVEQEYRKLPGINVEVSSFISDMADAYRRADLVISRAGATTLAELACLGLPAVLVPYPRSAGDHQLKNATFFVERGAARLFEHGTSEETLRSLLLEMTGDPSKLTSMSESMLRLGQPDAARRVADVVLRVAAEAEAAADD